MKKKNIQVLIVDDHPIVRSGLTRLLNQEPNLKVCGEAEDGIQAIKSIATHKPDVVVLDLSLVGMQGMDLLKHLKEEYPNLPIVVLSMMDENIYAERVLRAGAKAYVMKQEATEKVIQAIKKVMVGEIYVSQGVSSKILNRIADGTQEESKNPLERLTDRELEVFRQIAQGLSTRKIAEKLIVSIKTIESHREHIKEKLQLKDSIQLVQQALRFFPDVPAPLK